MEKLYSCRNCALSCLLVCFVILSTEAGTVTYEGPEKVEIGEPFSIECSASQFDHIKWTLNGTPFREGLSTTELIKDLSLVVARLTIPYATASHDGEYRCNSFQEEGHHVTILGVSTVELNYDQKPYKLFDYRGQLVLVCNFTLDADEAVASVKWLKNDAPVDTSSEDSRVSISHDKKTLAITKATEADAANYTCVIQPSGKQEMRYEITAALKPLVKLSPHQSVVEGEKLIVSCSVYGKPEPDVYWTIGNVTYNKSEGRIKLLPIKDQAARLQIDQSTMDDRGSYICGAELTLGDRVIKANETSTFVRIKDKMAALWPFLGICAEVLVLCAIILVYEKKRNKTEMDESDTDGSPEQKNTPDHSKDSEVRHRK